MSQYFSITTTNFYLCFILLCYLRSCFLQIQGGQPQGSGDQSVLLLKRFESTPEEAQGAG